MTAPAEDDWVQICAFDDPMQARMTLDFLRDHELNVETRGSSPEGVRNLYSPFDIRIVVRRSQLELATAALEALRAEPTEETPFRGPLPPPELASEGREEPDAPALAQKRPAFALVLAFLVPFGGGHFYAEHSAAGAILAASIVAFGVLSMSGVAFATGALVALIALDAVFGAFAVRRRNARLVAPAGTQRLFALGLTAMAVVVGFFFAVPKSASVPAQAVPTHLQAP